MSKFNGFYGQNGYFLQDCIVTVILTRHNATCLGMLPKNPLLFRLLIILIVVFIEFIIFGFLNQF